MQHAPPVPRGSSTPGETVLPWRQVNVLATYTAADHKYTLSEHTAVADGVDWLYLDTLSPMEDAVPWTTRAFSHLENHEWQSQYWPFLLDQTMTIHTLGAHCSGTDC